MFGSKIKTNITNSPDPKLQRIQIGIIQPRKQVKNPARMWAGSKKTSNELPNYLKK